MYKNIGLDGIKTGFFTVEQYSLASSIKTTDRRITAVASGFNSKSSRTRDSIKMLNLCAVPYYSKNYKKFTETIFQFVLVF